MDIPDPQMMNYDAQLAMQAANMSVPNPRFGGGFGNMMRRANVGLGNVLGKLQQGLFQIDPTIAAKMTPDQINKARNQAMLQMGLGMMNSAGRGAGLGQAIAQGYGGANENLQGGMQQQYQNMRTDQADTRQIERQGVEDTRYQSEWERQQQLDAERRANEEANRKFRESQAGLDQSRWEREFGANQGYRGASLALQAAAQGQRGLGSIPAGYRPKADGTLEYIPGGPADPTKPKPPGEAQVKQNVGIKNLGIAVDEYVKKLPEFGIFDQLSPDARAEMGNVYNNMMLQAKEAYNLGVLNGPDYEILQKVVTDPTTLKGAITSNEALAKQATELKRITQKMSGAKGPLQVGDIEDGYRYKGGNKADPKNWELAQ